MKSQKKWIILVLVLVLLVVVGVYFLFFYTPMKNGFYFVIKQDGRVVYSDEKDPKMELDGNIVSIKKELPKTDCMLSCIYHSASKPFKETEKAYIFAYQIEDTTYYYTSCKNEKEVFISTSILDHVCSET